MNFSKIGAVAAVSGLLCGVAGVAAGATVVKDHSGSQLPASVQQRLSTSEVSALAAQHALIGKGSMRMFGQDRYETAVAISQAGWDKENTDIVYLASGANFPDALAIAASTGYAGPLLLTPPNTLPNVVAEELMRLQPCFIVVVGGRGAVSDAVAMQADTFTNPGLCPEPPTTGPAPEPTTAS